MKKGVKKVLSVVLSAALVFTGVNIGDIATVNAADVKTITVNNAASLKGAQAELDSATGDVVINITSDITLTEKDWEGLLFYKTAEDYSRNLTVNGNGHKITGLNNQDNKKGLVAQPVLNNRKGSLVGLFSAVCAKEFTVKDLKLDSAEIADVRYIGSLAGYVAAYDVNIENVNVTK